MSNRPTRAAARNTASKSPEKTVGTSKPDPPATYASKAATGTSGENGPNAPEMNGKGNENGNVDELESEIDPALASLPAPEHSRPPPSTSENVNGEHTLNGALPDPVSTMSITESIAHAPPPRPADFSMVPMDEQEIDLSALDAANEEGGPPGSPQAKLMKAIAPPNATQPDAKWPPPPPNASVNLFIGRALLSHGNDNWPLKPNDIVNWIRKHYPAEWDGDEGRCSAHRVRTYLARKGADMYYEKLNQGNITGWRIRQNHLWRFENGGFLGRGMKQEEAIAAQHKENEIIATAAHKAAAAEALAAGHPGVRVSMSNPGVHDGAPAPKRPRKSTGQARRKNANRGKEEGDTSISSATNGDHSFYQPPGSQEQFQSEFVEAGPSEPAAGSTLNSASQGVDPTLMSASQEGQVDMHLVQQAMQAAAAANQGQMDELEMGMQLPIEMQMHGGDQDEGEEASYQSREYAYEGGNHPYAPQAQDQWGSDQAYGEAGYNGQ